MLPSRLDSKSPVLLAARTKKVYEFLQRGLQNPFGKSKRIQVFPATAPAEILKITPEGVVSTFATRFTEIPGIAFDAAHRLYVLESSTGGDFPKPATGKVVRVHGTDITFGPPGMGEIVKITLQAATSELGNISARALVQTGENVLIGGFILGANTTTTKVIIRGIGPSLSQLQVENALADPTLELHDSNGVQLLFDDNWQDDPDQAALISAAGLAPSDPLESAIFADLAPGAYTAIVAGKDDGTGVGLVEIYNLGQ